MCIANFSARQTLRECPDNKVPPLNRVSNLFMGSSLRSVCGTAEAHIHVGAGRTHQIRVDVSECDYTGVWLMMSAERNADLADITEEDIEEGALNDDQLQALWGRTLYEALRTHDAIVGSELGGQFGDEARHHFPDDLHDASASCCGASLSHISR